MCIYLNLYDIYIYMNLMESESLDQSDVQVDSLTVVDMMLHLRLVAGHHRIQLHESARCSVGF